MERRDRSEGRISSDLSNKVMSSIAQFPDSKKLSPLQQKTRSSNLMHFLAVLLEPLYCTRHYERIEHYSPRDKKWYYLAALPFELVKCTAEATLLWSQILY